MVVVAMAGLVVGVAGLVFRSLFLFTYFMG
jgi:hypothetical protein